MIHRITLLAALFLASTSASAGFVAAQEEASTASAPRAYWTIVANERHLCVADEAGHHRCYNTQDQAQIPFIIVDFEGVDIVPFTE